MSFPRYPAYKDSGVEWLGCVPEHWRVDRLKSVISLKKNIVGADSGDFKLLSLTLRGVIPRDLDNPQGKFPTDFDGYQSVQPDDLIFCLFDVEETPRAVGIAREAGMVTGAYTVGAVKADHCSDFIHYYYLSRDQYKALKMYYTGLRNVIRKENFYDIPCPLPPLTEQQVIAAFLDRETAKIDALVAEQEQLISLLKEKRQAVISHALTKGLDASVPMKDSGVQWLGMVPAHWDVKPMKWVIERNDGGVWGNDATGIDDTVVLRSTEQTADGLWQIHEPALRSLSEAEVAGSLLAPGDLLVTKSSGSSLHIGKTTLVTPEVAAIRCCYSNFMQRLRLKPDFVSELAWYFMNSEIARKQFDLQSNSSTGLANLNGSMLGDLVSRP